MVVSEKRKLWLEKNKDYYRLRYEKNKEEIFKQQRQYYLKHKEKIDKWRNQYQIKHKEEIKQYCIKNKEKIANYHKLYYQKNRKKINEWHKQYNKKMHKTDECFRLLRLLRTRIGSALKNNIKSKTTKKLLGCTVQECKQHLEKKFKEDMTWNNWAVNGWHIDHIRPCASFDLSKVEEQQKCFHYSNLQPLWAEENRSKGAKWNLL